MTIDYCHYILKHLTAFQHMPLILEQQSQFSLLLGLGALNKNGFCSCSGFFIGFTNFFFIIDPSKNSNLIINSQNRSSFTFYICGVKFKFFTKT